MILHVLFGQRFEEYEGEYGPEVLVCWDEFCVDENPEGFHKACDAAREEHGRDMAATRVIEVEIDQGKLRHALVGRVALVGKVKATTNAS